MRRSATKLIWRRRPRTLERARRRIADVAAANGLLPIASAATFVAIDCGGDGDFAARVLKGLIDRDVFVRKPLAAGINRCIRVSCGRDEEIDVFAEALPIALAAAGQPDVQG